MCWSDLECDNTNPVGEDRDFFSSCNPTRLHARRPSQFVKPLMVQTHCGFPSAQAVVASDAREGVCPDQQRPRGLFHASMCDSEFAFTGT